MKKLLIAVLSLLYTLNIVSASSDLDRKSLFFKLVQRSQSTRGMYLISNDDDLREDLEKINTLFSTMAARVLTYTNDNGNALSHLLDTEIALNNQALEYGKEVSKRNL